MENGEGNIDLNPPPEEQPEDVKRIKIRLGMFFDGTLNNRTNIEQRLMAAKAKNLTDEEIKEAAELKKRHSAADIGKARDTYKKHGAKNPDNDNSYESFFTNVVMLDRYFDDQPSDGYLFKLNVYIEGCGSIDMEGDKTSGFAFAIWESGIPARVKKGLSKAVEKIKKKQANRELIIEKLTIDVFGFSRGAATARSFIHAALFGQNNNDFSESLAEKLTSNQMTVEQVEVDFAGLFDTVSTYGVLKTVIGLGASNTASLKLDAISHARKVLQLASADEHREYFSLTNINSAGDKGRQIFLPGVHSDIGGGYRDNAHEQQTIYEDDGYSLPDAEKDRQHWIETGWYRPEEITLEYQEGYDQDEGDDTSWIRVNKASISNKYSHIPLQLMAAYAKENKVRLIANLERDQAIPDELATVKQEIDSYITKTARSSATHWLNNNAPWLKQLRHNYLHFSARIKTGHTPRFIRGKRGRVVLGG